MAQFVQPCQPVFYCPLFYCLTQVNVGKMDSPIEKWNLIIGNLALKQVRSHLHTQLLLGALKETPCRVVLIVVF